MSISEIRILPPLAIARLGSSPEPLANYDLQIDPEDPLGFRRLVPAETLIVDRATGEITGNMLCVPVTTAISRMPSRFADDTRQ